MSLEVEVGEALSRLARELFRTLDSLDEAIARAAELQLGVDVQAPGDVDAGEEQVADLLRDALVGRASRAPGPPDRARP